MSKHGAATPPSQDMTAGDDLRRLLADVDVAAADLERRLAMAHQAELDLAPKRAAGFAPPAAAPLPPTTTSDQASGFLAELEREAAGRQSSADQHDRRARAERLHETLGRIFGFLNALTRHANQLEPEINRPYRLDAQAVYPRLRWRGAFTDYRKESVSENARLSHITLRFRLVAPEPITIVRRWDQLAAFQQELHILNLQTLDELDPTKKPQQELLQLRLAPEFPVQVSFQGNYEANRIDILSRNLEGFGIAAFTVDAAQVTQSLLDDIGRFLLCRNPTLPAALQRVHYRPKT